MKSAFCICISFFVILLSSPLVYSVVLYPIKTSNKLNDFNMKQTISTADKVNRQNKVNPKLAIKVVKLKKSQDSRKSGSPKQISQISLSMRMDKHRNHCDDEIDEQQKRVAFSLNVKTEAEKKEAENREIVNQNLIVSNNIAIAINNNLVTIAEAPAKIAQANAEIQRLNLKQQAILNNITTVDQPKIDVLKPIAVSYENDFNAAALALKKNQDDLVKCQSDLTKLELNGLTDEQIDSKLKLFFDIDTKTTTLNQKKAITVAIKAQMPPIEELEDQYKRCIDLKNGLLINKNYLENSLPILNAQTSPHQSKIALITKAYNYALDNLSKTTLAKESSDRVIDVNNVLIDFCSTDLQTLIEEESQTIPTDDSFTSLIKADQFTCLKDVSASDCLGYKAIVDEENPKSDDLYITNGEWIAYKLLTSNQKFEIEQIYNTFMTNLPITISSRQAAIVKLGNDYTAKGIECDNIQTNIFQKNYQLTQQDPRSIEIAEANERQALWDLKKAEKAINDAKLFHKENCNTLSSATQGLQNKNDYAKRYLDDSSFSLKIIENNIVIENAQIEALKALVIEQNNLIALINTNVQLAQEDNVKLTVKQQNQLNVVVENSQTDLAPFVNFLNSAILDYNLQLAKLADLKENCDKKHKMHSNSFVQRI